MAKDPISREECERTHTMLNGRLDEIHTDIKDIRDNHIVHINEELTNQKWKFYLIAIVTSAALGIKILEIFGMIV